MDRYTAIIDGVFAHPIHACKTLQGVLATLNAAPTAESRKVIATHPEFAALMAHLRRMTPHEAEHTAQRLHSYVVRQHSVRACSIDHARSMEKFLRSL